MEKDILPDDYNIFLQDIKKLIRQTQHNIAVIVDQSSIESNKKDK